MWVLNSLCSDRVKVPKTKHAQYVIDRAYDIFRQKGVHPYQEHCLVETGASLQ